MALKLWAEVLVLMSDRDGKLIESSSQLWTPGSKYINSFEFRDLSAAARGAHHESLQSQVIVHRDLDVLLRPQIAFGGLDRRVPEQELDLLQIPAVLTAELGV